MYKICYISFKRHQSLTDITLPIIAYQRCQILHKSSDMQNEMQHIHER